MKVHLMAKGLAFVALALVIMVVVACGGAVPTPLLEDTDTAAPTPDLPATVAADVAATIAAGATPTPTATPTTPQLQTAAPTATPLAPAVTEPTTPIPGPQPTIPALILPAAVAALALVPESVSLEEGQSRQLESLVESGAGNRLTGRPVLWSSSNSAVAGISGTGQVTGTSAGVASITASVEGVGAMAIIEVRHGPVASVEIGVGAGAQLVAALQDGPGHILLDRTVTWTSSDQGVLQVDPVSGALTVGSLGTAIVTATAEGVSDSASIQVSNEPVALMSVAPETASIQAGEDIQMSAAPQDAVGQLLSGRTVTWSSSDEGVAQVSTAGVVTGVSVGTTTITAASGGIQAIADITVTLVAVAVLALSTDISSLEEANSIQLSAEPQDANGQTLDGRAVTWSSSDNEVAQVSSTGLVTGVAAGTATVSATVEGVSGTATVNVSHGPVASVEISLGAGTRLVAALRDEAGHLLQDRTVSWFSNDPGVLGVEAQTGQLTVGTVGVATVTATAEGVTASANIAVNPEPVASVSVTPGEAALEAGASVQLGAAPEDGAGNLLTGRTVSWTSAPEGTATVSDTGLVTGVTPGTAVITATVDGVSGTAKVAVSSQSVLAYSLLWSDSSSRSNPALLEEATVSGTIYVFTNPNQGVASVSFYVDDPNRQGSSYRSEGVAPYDLGGTQGNSTAGGYDTSQLSNRDHTIDVEISLTDGRTVVVKANFEVENQAPPPLPPAKYSLLWSSASDRSNPAPLDEANVSVNIYVFTDPDLGVDSVRFYLNDPNRQGNPYRTENNAPYDLAGTGNNDEANKLDTSQLGTGPHTVTAQITQTDGSAVLVKATFSAPLPPVIQTPAASVEVIPSATSIDVGESLVLAAVVRDVDGNPLDRPVVWRSSAPSVAAFPSASSPGTFYGAIVPFDRTEGVQATGLSPGAATITVSYGEVSGSASLTVSLAFTSISAGRSHTCGLDPLGNAYCWGRGEDGRLGNWSTDAASTPVLVAGGLSFKSISAGGSYTCGVTTDGDGYCWGKNNWGVLGNGSTDTKLTPEPLSGGHTFASISAGIRHTCGLDTDGKAFCWGFGGNSALGTGNGEIQYKPENVVGGHTFVSISVGSDHTCGATTVGDIFCWGIGVNGRLGTGSTANELTPALVVDNHNFVSVSAGLNHTCGVTAEGQIYCWGAGNGRLGDGLETESATPVRVSSDLIFKSVNVANEYTCAVTTQGVVYCWGGGSSGQLGNGLGIRRLTPTRVSNGNTFNVVSANVNHACGVTTEGVAYCWGRANDFQLGNGSGLKQFKPDEVISGPTFRSVNAGDFHTCGINLVGILFCWGDGQSGQLGNGSRDNQLSPVRVSGNLRFSSVNGGRQHTCGVTIEGDLYCWGEGQSGQLGNGSVDDQLTPVEVAGNRNFVSVSAGLSHTCAITTDDGAYCWGSNSSGQLGDDDSQDGALFPVPVLDGDTFIKISAGQLHTCAVKSQNRAYCWGDDSNGKLGGSLADMNIRTPVSGGTRYSMVSAGSEHTCGFSNDTGTAFCWGLGDSGRLGNGSTDMKLTPTIVTALLIFVSLDTSGAHSCGVSSLAQAYCWGFEPSGGIGYGSTDKATSPVPVSGGLTFMSVSLGANHTCGLTTQGDLYCWGKGESGRLGNGTTDNQLTPAPISSLS